MAPISGIALRDALDSATKEVDQVVAVLRCLGHEPATISLAVGDRALLKLAEQVNGAAIELTAICPACGTTNMIELKSDALVEHRPRSRWCGPNRGVREPTYADLEDLGSDPINASVLLGTRCAFGAVDPSDALEALDDIDGSLAGPLSAACVDCGCEMAIEADVEQLALHRLRRVADRIDHDVHLLALHYGWDLATIESLTDSRRNRFAQLIESN